MGIMRRDTGREALLTSSDILFMPECLNAQSIYSSSINYRLIYPVKL